MRLENGELARLEPCVHPKTREVVLRQLSTALQRGHWRIAIRSFLVLRVYQFNVPARYERELKRLIDNCPTGDLNRICSQVLSFAEMRSMRRSACDQFVIPVDKFKHLHDFSRRARTSSAAGPSTPFPAIPWHVQRSVDVRGTTASTESPE